MKNLAKSTAASKLLRIVMCVVLAFGMALPAGVIKGAQKAYADPPINLGNPFENGDLVWDDNTQKWKANGLEFFATLNSEHPNQAPPFDYPFVATVHGPEFDGWGTSSFSATIWEARNTRGLHYDNGLPAMTHCCQRDNKTPTLGVQRPGRAILLENLSGWGADGVYTGWFVVLIDNDHLHQNFDQASLGTTYIKMRWKDMGYLDVVKSSANKKITDNNNCYSLAGAKYGIYADKDCKKQIGTITTDDKGYAKSDKLAVGKYWVKEIEASKGYALDANVYPVDVKSHATAATPTSQVKSSEVPKGDPMVMKSLVTKVDKNGLPTGQGEAGLEGAEYTVKYYDGYFKSSEEAENAVKAGTAHVTAWVFKTDADGRAFFNEKYKISGGALPKASDGVSSTLPLGTVTIQETKVPNGYNVDEKIHVQQITDNSGATSVTSETHTYQTVTSTEIVERGDFRLVKEVPTTLDEDKQSTSRLVVEGVQFQLINATNADIISPEDGKTKVAPGAVVCTITTDENGMASTKAGKTINGWAIPKDWTGALAFGTYTVHEVIPTAVAEKYKTEHGITMLPVEDFAIQINKEGQYSVPLLVSNKIPNTPIQIEKKDVESNKDIFASDGTYSVYKYENNTLGEKVTFENHYTQTTEDAWKSTKGKLTLPMKLEGGTYAVVEVAAPDGYVLDATPVKFEVKDNNTWQNPQKVEVKDTPIKGEIEIVKTDETTGKVLAGVDYTVRANADIVTGDGTVHAKAGETVATVTTDVNGTAHVTDLYLGSYTVFETKAPDGYALDTEEHEVNILSQGQNTPVVSVRSEMINKPSTLKIKKLSDKDETPLSGAEFKIWNDAAEPTMTFDGESITKAIEGLTNAKAIESLVIANEADFKAQVADAYATKTPSTVSADVNFSLNGATHSAKLKVETQFENDKPKCVVVKLDALPRSVIEYYDANNIPHVSSTAIDWIVDAISATGADAFSMTATTDAEGIISVPYLKHGKYHLQEVNPPTGYSITDKSIIDFEVNDQGQVASATGDVLGATGVITVYNTPQELKTTATDSVTKDHTGFVAEEVTIVDEVAYKNLKVGETYKVSGKLMDRLTGKDFLVDGKPVVAEKEFVAEKADGVEMIEFTFPGAALAGRTIVVFEDLYYKDTLVATHADLEDRNQTVEYRAKIRTTATDKADGDHVAEASEQVTIIDKVAYEGLIKGNSYTMRGTLMHKNTGKPIQVDGKDLIVNKEFVADNTSGEVEMEFTFNATELAGSDVVVFEDCYGDIEGEAVLVGQHADINDEGQTVSIQAPGVPYDKTGSTIAGLTSLVALLTLGGASIAAYGLRKRKLSSSVEDALNSDEAVS